MLRGTRLALILIAIAIVSGLAACSGGQATGPQSLTAGNYTPLGGVQKNNNPTASDYGDLQAAENGTLGQPALVEFYADY